MLGDYFPPAVFVTSPGPTRAVSIEYSIQIHTNLQPLALAPGDYLTWTVHASHAAEGFAIEGATIWSPVTIHLVMRLGVGVASRGRR